MWNCLINQGRLEQAQEILDGVPPQNRDAEWYFLNGTVLYRRGWFDQAYTSFSTAVRMDPTNPEYRNIIVKVTGYTTRFICMAKPFQIEFVGRNNYESM